jgi:hypothetical protein
MSDLRGAWPQQPPAPKGYRWVQWHLKYPKAGQVPNSSIHLARVGADKTLCRKLIPDERLLPDVWGDHHCCGCAIVMGKVR